jgi:polar amino acid transport system substrate-binding protein
VALAVAALLAVTSLSAFGSASAQAASSNASKRLPATIQSRGYFSVAILSDYAPYTFIGANQKPAGLDIDLLSAVAKELGVTVRWTPIQFSAMISAVANGRFDVAAAGIGDFTSREKVVNIVDSYITKDGLVTWAGNPLHLSAKSSLCGLHLGEAAGAIEIDLISVLSKKCVASGKPAISDSVFESTSAIFLAIKDHRVQASPFDMATAVYLTKHQYPGLVAVTGTLPGSESLDGYVVAEKDTQLAKALEWAVQKLIVSGEYRQILSKWGVAKNGLKSSSINDAAHYSF